MIGLFDPYYYGYCEDLDLSWRAWLFGYKVIYAPKSFIYHKIGQIFKDLPLNLFFYSEKNKLRTILKNYQLISIFKILPVYIVKRIGIFLRAFRRPNESPKDFITVYVKAFYWNIIHLKSLIQYRKWIQAYRIKNDEYIFNLMNRSVKLDENLSKLRV